MSENCDVIAIFPIFSQFGAIRKTSSGRSLLNIFSLIVTFYLTKTENKTNKSLRRTLHVNFQPGLKFIPTVISALT